MGSLLNIIIETRGTRGDLVPLMALARGLCERGHRVSFLTHCQYSALTRNTGAEFKALDTPAEFEEFIKDVQLLQNPRGSALFFERHLMRTALREYALISECCDPAGSVLVVRHMSGLGPSLAAERLGIPLVPVFTAAVQVTALPLLRTLCEQVLSDKINSIRARVGLEAISDWDGWLKWPCSIATWPAWFNDVGSRPLAGLTMVGFTNDDESETGEVPPEVAAILDGGQRTALITGGTGRWSLDSDFYARAVEGCTLAGFKAILVTQYECLVPHQLPRHVSWFKSLPFRSVMSKVSVVIHHGGAGTTARSIAAGIPQLALVVGGDRPENGARLEQLGVGERLLPFRWTADNISTSLRRLSESQEIHRKCDLIQERAQNSDSVALACSLIEEVPAQVATSRNGID